MYAFWEAEERDDLFEVVAHLHNAPFLIVITAYTNFDANAPTPINLRNEIPLGLLSSSLFLSLSLSVLNKRDKRWREFLKKNALNRFLQNLSIKEEKNVKGKTNVYPILFPFPFEKEYMRVLQDISIQRWDVTSNVK